MNERSFLFYANQEICQEQKDPNYDLRKVKIIHQLKYKVAAN